MTSSPSSRKARQFRGTARTAIPVAAESLSSADLSRGSTNANTSVSLSKMPLKRKQDVSLEVVSGTLAVAEPMRWKKTHDKRTGHGIPQQRAMLSRKVQTSPQSGRPPDHNDCIEDERLEDERLEDERLEAERLEAERLKAERLEDERSEDERSENANLTPIERNLFEDSISNRISKRERPDAGNHEDRQQQSQRQFSISIVRYRCSHRSASSRIATTPSVEALLGDEELDMLSTAETLLPSSRSKQAETGKGLGVTSQFELLKKVVLEKLTGRRPIPLTGLDDEHDKVHHLLEQTVTAGEGNSMLIIGARGTGKTTLVNAVLGEIAAKHREHFHVVRLNGFVQTDDKLALREIWRQLGREMEVEEEGQAKNYADTLTTLLALLSHPSELSGAEPEQVAKSVIFIMDEFDLFAGHPRQTLLYNLFDIAQSRKAPIAVLGLTTRVDVAESLEKRVKSRFSHRYIHTGLPKTFMAFQHICKTALQLQAEALDFQERAQLCSPPGTAKKNRNSKMDGDCIAAWNASIEVDYSPTSTFHKYNSQTPQILFKSPPLIQHLSYIYHTSKSIPTLLTTFLLPVSLLTPTSRYLTPTSICSENSLQPPDSKLHLLPCLPTVALVLLIAAARLDVILDIDTCNFDMAYEEYSSLVAKAKVTASTGGRGGVGVGITGRVWGKEVARGMWEKLVDLELLLPVVGAGGSGLRQGEMVRCDVALEELEGAMEGHLERGLQKWCREI